MTDDIVKNHIPTPFSSKAHFRTLIISGFPGVGKSSLVAKNPDALDSDSSMYTWYVGLDGEKIRNPLFPENYIEHIKQNIGKVPVILVSTHRDVRNALLENEIPFTLVYPNRSLKDEYVERYISRESPEPLINAIKDNWDIWIDDLKKSHCDRLELQRGEFLDIRAVEFLVKLKRLRDYQASTGIEPGGRSDPIKGVPEFF